jgi:xylan 1,4-beta-xylosidase
MTQFEFASYYYQYKIEYSTDGKKWKLYADRSQNRTSGSPMIDDKNVKARYLKLTVLATEKTGMYAAVWNMKVYGELFHIPLRLENKPSTAGPGAISKKEMLINLDLNDIPLSDTLLTIANKGTLGGNFTKSGQVTIERDDAEGMKYLHFKNGALTLNDRSVPKSLEWNGAFTVAVGLKTPKSTMLMNALCRGATATNGAWPIHTMHFSITAVNLALLPIWITISICLTAKCLRQISGII